MEAIYFSAPINLWRDFILEDSNSMDCLYDVQCWCIGDYETIEDAQRNLRICYHKKDVVESRCKELRGEYNSNIKFSISRTLMWDYFDNITTKTEYDKLLLLAYLSLKSLSKTDRPCIANNDVMFARMAGYDSFEEAEESEDEICKFFDTPKKKRYYGEKLRLDLMTRFQHFHAYSTKGKRGFAFMISNKVSRITAMSKLASHMEKRTQKYKQNELKKLMKVGKTIFPNPTP